MSASLAEKLQIWGFEGDTILFGDASLGAGFTFCPLDISCKEDEEVNDVKGAITNFLNALPSGLDLQFVQKISRDHDELLSQHVNLSKNSGHKVASILTENRVKNLEKADQRGELPKFAYYVFLRQKTCTQHSPKKWSKFLFGSKSEPRKPALEEHIRSFERLVKDFENSLRAVGVSLSRLQQREIASIAYQQWNPRRCLPLDHYAPDYVRSSLIFTDVVISERGFSLADIHHRVISLKNLPELTYAAMVRILEELPFNTDLYLSISVPDQFKEMESLKTQRRMAFSMASQSSHQVKDLESQNKLDEIEEVLENLVAQGEKIFYFSLSIVVKSDSNNDLEDKVAATLLKIRELAGAQAFEETYAAFEIFNETSIPNARSQERHKRIKSSNLADFIPLYGTWTGHSTPRMLFRHPKGHLLSFDPFSPDLTNGNQVVSGSSGSGKSFLVNSLLLQALREDPRIYIIDIGGSYQKMTRLLDGQYIPLALDQGIVLNPFDLKDHDQEPTHHKIKFLLSLIETIAREEGSRRLPKIVTAEIESAIKEVYLLPHDQHNLAGLRDILLGHPDAEIKKIGRILKQWTGESAFGSFLDRCSTVNLNRRIVCFDLKGLESYPDLQAVALLLITDLVWREIEADKQSLKFVVFDESWKLLENEAGAAFIGEIFRTFRKYYASAIAISQTMDDFANSTVAGAILPNSSIKWILRQSGSKIETLKSTLGLGDQEISQISGLKQDKGHYSEAFLMAGDRRSLVRIKTSPLEYWISTSDPRDLVIIDQMKKSHPEKSESDLICELAESFPQGMAQGEVK